MRIISRPSANFRAVPFDVLAPLPATGTIPQPTAGIAIALVWMRKD
jgi:hypothetical protein